MYPTNFNQLKKYFKVGMKLVLIDCNIKPHKALGIERSISKVQSNAIKFDTGSWLGLGSTGEKASNFTFDNDTFTFKDNYTMLKYKFL